METGRLEAVKLAREQLLEIASRTASQQCQERVVGLLDQVVECLENDGADPNDIHRLLSVMADDASRHARMYAEIAGVMTQLQGLFQAAVQ